MPSLNTGNAILSNAIAVNSSYNVGLGTTTINEKLDVEGSMVLRNSGTYSTSLTRDIVYRSSTSTFGMQPIANIQFATVGNAESEMRFVTRNGAADYATRMTISKAGNVGIGTSSPGANLEVVSAIRVTNTASTGFASSQLQFFAHNGSSVAYGGGIFQTNSTFAYQQIAANQTNIYGFASGGMRIATGNAPIIFGTGNTDLDFSTERMRITSGGNVGIGTTNVISKLQIGSPVVYTGGGYTLAMTNGVTDFLITLNSGQSGSSTTFYSSTDYYFGKSGPSSTGIITAFGFNNISDYRMKENLSSYNPFDIINSIKTYKYDMIDTKETQYGVLAHEVQEILPHIVVGVKDGDRPQSVDYSKIVPILIKAIQELNQKIEAQQQTINSLINR
jgi:hypothetical protein